MARGTSTLSCGRELLEITEQLIRDMPEELPGTVREGATALQLLKGAKNEEVHCLTLDISRRLQVTVTSPQPCVLSGLLVCC